MLKQAGRILTIPTVTARRGIAGEGETPGEGDTEGAGKKRNPAFTENEFAEDVPIAGWPIEPCS